MAYLAPAEFVTKMVDAGESKLLMSTRDTLVRAYMPAPSSRWPLPSRSASRSTPATR